MAQVLVVDDDDDIRTLVALQVRRGGHDVLDVGDPVRALALAGDRDFDLAVLDWSMPGMDGGELCQRLLMLPHLAGLPVLIVTAFTDDATRQRAIECGAASFMAKPFRLGELRERVDELVGRGSARSQP
ncbi:response regulator [Nocardioides okcheonensis]|uniref:response regulator n=1 Tax=Nocardioides okcheonensis TaxID=2894081 RepID=UPI001E50B5FD|nr:response regulator [Nocardioides okcheonensis]UFN44656.1 response regulator [Nocardioides okcheonensis]